MMLIVGLFLSVGTGCTADNPLPVVKQYNGKIKRFTFGYKNSLRDGSYSYEIDTSGEVPMFYYSSFEYTGNKDQKEDLLQCEVDESFVEALNQLCVEENVARFDDFEGRNENILDGFHFNLGVYSEDRSFIYASGNYYPKDFTEFKEKMDELFAPLVEKVINEFVEVERNEEITGELERVMISITQHGASGHNEYFFSVLENAGGTGENLKYRITSREGGEFPKDVYLTYHEHEEDVSWILERFTEIIDKYNLISWDRYEETAENASNCEWFQFGFSFTSDQNISAMGTEHPEDYDAVREEIMEIIKEVVEYCENKDPS